MPHYKAHLFCCINERPDPALKPSCGKQGGIELHAYLKAKVKEAGLQGKIRVNKSGCLDVCEKGPALVIYPEATWYSFTSREDIDRIFEEHLILGQKIKEFSLD